MGYRKHAIANYACSEVTELTSSSGGCEFSFLEHQVLQINIYINHSIDELTGEAFVFSYC